MLSRMHGVRFLHRTPLLRTTAAGVTVRPWLRMTADSVPRAEQPANLSDRMKPVAIEKSERSAAAAVTSPQQLAVAASTATAAGCVLGCTGVGGGIILITGLTTIPMLAYTQLYAIGTASGALACCYSTGALVWCSAGFCDLPAALCLGTAGFGGVLMGVRFAGRVSDTMLKLGFAAVLCGVVCPMSLYSVLFFSSKQQSSGGGDSAKAGDNDSVQARREMPRSFEEAYIQCVQAFTDRPFEAARHCLVGAVVGVLSGAFAIGDTPAMIAYLAACGYQQKDAVGTALLACSPMLCLATAMHMLSGNAIMVVVPLLAASISVGSWIGARWSCGLLTDQQLRIGFAVMVALLGLRMGSSAYKSL